MPEVIDCILDTAVSDAIRRGFPFYQYSLEEKHKEFAKIQRYDTSTVLSGDVIRQTMHGLGLAWSYFPHAWEVRVKSMLTAWEVFNNPTLLRKAIDRRLKRGGLQMLREDGSMTDSQIRKALRSFSGVQSVSNFRPTAAAAIYKKYAGDGVVWDMSCGYGGRLLGAYASGAVKKYIGTDPAQKTMLGLKQIAIDFAHLPMCVDLNILGSEHFVPREPVDLCFTSPPYFNTERYAEEVTQSCVAYDDVSVWNEDFLRKTISNCRKAIKDGGYLILNVANTSTHKTLEDDTLSIAAQEGFSLESVLRLQLSSISKGGFKYEPAFVFKTS